MVWGNQQETQLPVLHRWSGMRLQWWLQKQKENSLVDCCRVCGGYNCTDNFFAKIEADFPHEVILRPIGDEIVSGDSTAGTSWLWVGRSSHDGLRNRGYWLRRQVRRTRRCCVFISRSGMALRNTSIPTEVAANPAV